jgi:hypothetical protein
MTEEQRTFLYLFGFFKSFFFVLSLCNGIISPEIKIVHIEDGFSPKACLGPTLDIHETGMINREDN